MTQTPLTEKALTMALVRGAVALEPGARGLRARRLTEAALAHGADAQLRMTESQPAGVRLVFTTAATCVELDVVPTRYAYAGLPPRPQGVYDLRVDGAVVGRERATDADTITIDMRTGETRRTTAAVQTIRFDGLGAEPKSIALWLPHNESTELVALRADASITPVTPDGSERTWLHYGSSISQGSNALEPTNTWAAVAALSAGVELTNLGFGGGAMLDGLVARAIRDTPANAISLKVGINIVNSDAMRLRAFTPAVHTFLDTIRDGHPNTPILVVSPLFCGIHEESPGPGAFDVAALAEGRVAFVATGDRADVAAGRLTLRVIRAELERIVAERAENDPHLAYLDGLTLFGEEDAREHPLADGLHLRPEAHRIVGERFAVAAFGEAGPLASASLPTSVAQSVAQSK